MNLLKYEMKKLFINRNKLLLLAALFIVVLMAGGLSNYLGRSARELLQLLIDFNFSTMSMLNTIFGSNKMFNILGTSVSYGVAAFMPYMLLGALACLLVFAA